MKIVYFIRDITDCGGIQQTTCLMINSLKKMKPQYDIVIISLYHKYEVSFFELDEKVKSYALFEHAIDTRKAYIKIRRALRTYLNNIDFEVIIVQGTAFANYISNVFWKNKKIVVCEHGYYNMGGIGGLHWLGARKALKQADAIVTLTDLDSQNYMKRNKKNILVTSIYNPSLSSEKINNFYSIDSKTIVSCGSLSKIKRFDHAIEAARTVFSRHPDWIWEIYGDGQEKNDLQNLINKYNLQNNVRLMGYEKRKQIIYGAKSFLVLTSSFEGFGMVLVEAMQYNLPLISYKIKYGPQEIIEEDFIGYLVDNGNVENLADTIEKMITKIDDRKRLSDNCAESLKRFSIEHITEKWIDLFDKL